MSGTVINQQSRDSEHLPIDERKRKLESFGLLLNNPEPAIICYQCRYALKPNGNAVSEHLREKYSMPV